MKVLERTGRIDLVADALGLTSLDQRCVVHRVGLAGTQGRAMADQRRPGTSTFDRIDALLANPELYELADAVPDADPRAGGRPRHYPAYMWLLFDALLSVYGSARRVEAELAHPIVWGHLRQLIRTRFPDDPEHWLPAQPMRRHHYLYGRTRYLTDPEVLAELGDDPPTLTPPTRPEHSGCSTPTVRGSWTHPDLVPHAPRRRQGHHSALPSPPRRHQARQGHRRTPPRPRRTRRRPALRRHRRDRVGHQVGPRRRPQRPTSTAGSSSTSTGSPPPAAKPTPPMDCFDRAPTAHCPGAQGVIYDTALRGVHHQTLLRDLGWLSDQQGHRRQGRRQGQPRRKARASASRSRPTSKTGPSPLPDGPSTTISLFAAGRRHRHRRTHRHRQTTLRSELARVRTHRNADKRQVPLVQRLPTPRPATAAARSPSGSTATTTTRSGSSTAPRTSGPSRRPTPTSSALYRRRNDAESINRALDDTLWLRRAHTVGHAAPAPQPPHLRPHASTASPSGATPPRHERPAHSRSPPDRLRISGSSGFDAPRLAIRAPDRATSGSQIGSLSRPNAAS